jgi:3-dehydroquinate synthase
MQVLKLSDYSIFVGDIWLEQQVFLKNKNYNKIFVLVDDNTDKCCYSPFVGYFPSKNFYKIKIAAGEAQKNIDTCQAIWRGLFEGNGDRKSLLINLGGGVIGDMGGFCAATFKRGIDFIQMPTTLLSQVDASIGGKLGIDFNNVKNSIGVFANPRAVFIHTDFLKTLPQREIRSGFAEIIKHALIADKKQWKALQNIQDLSIVDWAKYLLPSLKIKQKVVKADPFEKGLRKALNFGHTIGHAVESMALASDDPLTHGEAIAIGMICEAYLSYKTQGLKKEELDTIIGFILKYYSKYNIQQYDFKQLIDLMKQDKKNESMDINFSFLPEIGSVKVNCTAPPQLIEESLLFYQKL